ncbi:MAG: hypothetical protein AB1716_05420 [Planctomycetota bacterium]
MGVFQTRDERLRNLASVMLALAFLASAAALAGGIVLLARSDVPAGLALLAAGVGALTFAILLYCQVVLINKFLNYAYRVYDTLLESVDLLRRNEEHSRFIADNSSLSEATKRIVYREKDYEYLRDAIQGAIVRQDWEAAEHLIRDLDADFGFHDEAAHLRGKLEEARRATTEERVRAAVARFETLCQQRKWEQARAESERLRTLFPDQPAILDLPAEIERRRHTVKQQLLQEYEAAVRTDDLDHAHRLLFALDQYLAPKEAEALKESARGVFRARLEQLKTRFTIAVSYKQFPSAIEAGERLIREFPNSGYAQEISKLLPVLQQRARQQTTHASSAERPATA